MKKRMTFLGSLLSAISFNGGRGMVDVELAKKPSWRDRPVRPYQEGDLLFDGADRQGKRHRKTKRQRRQARIDEARTVLESWRQARNAKRGNRFNLDRAVAIAERDYDRARGVVR